LAGKVGDYGTLGETTLAGCSDGVEQCLLGFICHQRFTVRP